jgi:hypothetical protein
MNYQDSLTISSSIDTICVAMTGSGFLLPPMSVTLCPVNPPIVIPPGGGNFQFDATVANNTATPVTFQAWIKVQLPNSSWYGPVLGPFSLTLPAHQSLTRQRNQVVPASAPAGQYTYRGWLGTYPNVFLDSSSFTFTKAGAGIQNLGFSEWTNTGEVFPDGLPSTQGIYPLSFMLHPCSPNPFNPTTAISYQLQAASRVSLKIYDTAGRLVATLVDGWMDAGEHQATFNGSKLASGVYLARLESGEFTAAQKLVLLK